MSGASGRGVCPIPQVFQACLTESAGSARPPAQCGDEKLNLEIPSKKDPAKQTSKNPHEQS